MDEKLYFVVCLSRDSSHNTVMSRTSVVDDDSAALVQASRAMMSTNAHCMYVVGWNEFDGITVCYTILRGVDYPNNSGGPKVLREYIADCWDAIRLEMLGNPHCPSIRRKVEKGAAE